MRYLAIDYGDKKTGLAVCDAGETLASPLNVLGTNTVLTDSILRIAAQYGAEGIVVGLPLNMDGSEGQRAKKVRAFAKKLKKAASMPIFFHDERLSSFEAKQKMAGMDLSRKGRRIREDAIAAATILESFIEHKHQKRRDSLIKGVSVVSAAGPEELAEKALEIFGQSFSEAVSKRGCFFVAFSGGKTPEGFFRLLGQSPQAAAWQWDKEHLFWADERCVGPEHPASNYGLAARTFLQSLPIPQANIHRIKCESGDLEESAREYERVLRKVFGQRGVSFDLVILGLGEDGHIASLMPGSETLKIADRLTAIQTATAKDYARITLAAPVLQNAGKLVVMVSGAQKRRIVREIFTSEPRPDVWPVHLLWPVMDRVVWLIDRTAGDGLSFESFPAST